MNNENAVSYEETKDEIIMHIRGTIFENLQKIADTMNGVSWCDSDNTASGILDNFIIGYWLRQLETKPAKLGTIPVCGISETVADIVNGIDTGFEDGTPEHEKRKDELLNAFDAAGF